MSDTPRELSREELAKIARTRGSEKRALNWDIYIEQLLAHADWCARRIAELERHSERQVSAP